MSISTPSYIASDSYPYECSCGERYSTVDAAYHCRKCRNYCVFGYCTHVVDIRNGSVVRGEAPSEERYAEASARAVARWEEERKQFEAELREMSIREAADSVGRPRLNAEMQRRAAEENEDALYKIQDEMNGLRS
mgnify:CR=1 FL=1